MLSQEMIDGVTAFSESTTRTISDLNKETKEIIRSYYGKVAWFSIFYQILLFVVYFGSIALVVQRIIPFWVGFVTSTICAYYSLGPLHDAMHGNISGQGSSLEKVPLLDTIFGWISSIPLIMPFSSYRMMHLKHHAHTNDPDADPDYYLAAESWWKAARNAFLRRLLLITTMIRGGPKAKMPQTKGVRQAKLVMILINYASLLVLFVSFLYGHFIEFLLLWYVPSKIATLFAEILTGYLPHFPFKSTEQFKHSRIIRFWGSGVLLFGHDHHALHHLFPRVPFFKYREVFEKVSPDLRKEGLIVDDYKWWFSYVNE